MRNFLMASTALACVVTAMPAFAQTAVAQNDVATSEIVVTAQKRPERLRDIPVAASVVSNKLLLSTNSTDITDLNKLIPSVQLKGTYNGRVPLGIRGISTNANEGAVGLTSGVAIQIDGVPVPPDSFAANALDDIAQVEVLKGPQATLGGRTASAGVINIVTGAPTKSFKGKFGVSITNDGEQRVNMSISGPISSTLGYSLAGYDSHTTYLVHNVRTGNDADSKNFGIRGKLKFEPTSDFDATLAGRYSHFHSDGGTFTGQYLTPGATVFGFVPVAFGPTGPTAFFTIPNSAYFAGVTIAPGNTQSASINDNMFATWEDTDASLALNYHIGDTTISSITAYQRETQDSKQDITLGSQYFFDVLTGGFAPHFGNSQFIQGDVQQFSQEFKIATDASKPISLLAGAFYSNNTVVSKIQRNWIANDQAFRVYSGTQSSAVYARVTGKLGESTSVTGGLRYNHDKLTFQKTQYSDFATASYQSCETFASPSGPTHAGGISCALPTNTDSSNTLVGDISLKQHFGKDTMVYGSYTRGYKPRAFNTAQDFYLAIGVAPTAANIATLTAAATKKETIDSFEVGMKTKIQGLGSLNLAAFTTNYDGYQVQIFPIVAGGLSPLTLSNGAARTRGFEADFNSKLGDNTDISVAAAYIDAKFTSFANAPCYGGQTLAQGCAANGTQDLTGKQMPDAPKFKFNLDVQHHIPIGSATIILGGNLSYRTSAFFQANNNPQTLQPAFALLNLSMGVDVDDGNVNLTAFVNNVTNKFYLTNAEDFFSGIFGSATVQGNYVIGQPARDAHRYFGARATFKF